MILIILYLALQHSDSTMHSLQLALFGLDLSIFKGSSYKEVAIFNTAGRSVRKIWGVN